MIVNIPLQTLIISPWLSISHDDYLTAGAWATCVQLWHFSIKTNKIVYFLSFSSSLIFLEKLWYCELDLFGGHKEYEERVTNNKYRKSYERECISWFMGTSDVLKVLKIAWAVGECNLRTCSNLALPRCSHGNFSVLHSITSIALYNLFMHSSLTNQKRDILLSI